MIELIVQKDLRSLLGPVRDQGRRPTCLAFAASTCHEHAHSLLTPFSVEWLYHHAVLREGGGPEDGCSPAEVCAVLAGDGQPLEIGWPYLAIVPQPWSRPVSVDELFYAEEAGMMLDFADIVGAIEDERPVVLGLSIGQTFQEPQVVGDFARIADDPTDPDQGDGHAVVAVGTGSVLGEELILVRNSWGTRWGASGHAWFSRAYWESRALAAFGLTARH